MAAATAAAVVVPRRASVCGSRVSVENAETGVVKVGLLVVSLLLSLRLLVVVFWVVVKEMVGEKRGEEKAILKVRLTGGKSESGDWKVF